MNEILLASIITLITVSITIPVIVCYLITGKLKFKDLKKIYYLLFRA